MIGTSACAEPSGWWCVFETASSLPLSGGATCNQRSSCWPSRCNGPAGEAAVHLGGDRGDRARDSSQLFRASWNCCVYKGLHLSAGPVYRGFMSTDSSATEAEIWSRAIRPGVGDLSPQAAREWLRLQLADSDAERVRELSRKANSGQLTGAEERELESYLNVGRTLEFLKAKARLSLRDHAGA
jgi:hypothetical protein